MGNRWPRTGVRELSLGLQNLSVGLAEELRDQSLSEGCRLREAAQQIAARRILTIHTSYEQVVSWYVQC